MQPFINRPFINNITPHPHVTPSHIITLALPTLKPSISLIHSHIFFFNPIIHHENPQNHLKQETEQQMPKTTQPKPLKVVHPSPLITATPSTFKEPQNSNTPCQSTMHAGKQTP